MRRLDAAYLPSGLAITECSWAFTADDESLSNEGPDHDSHDDISQENRGLSPNHRCSHASRDTEMLDSRRLPA